jgi:hypothetical protein
VAPTTTSLKNVLAAEDAGILSETSSTATRGGSRVSALRSISASTTSSGPAPTPLHSCRPRPLERGVRKRRPLQAALRG